MSCVNISTVDDSVIEHTETLVVTLASAEPSVAIFPQQGMVEILDNDGKLNCICTMTLWGKCICATCGGVGV